MNYYCTLFDSFYLSRGLILYNSLKKHSKAFHLFIFAFDDVTGSILKSLNLECVTVISLSDFENDELKAVKLQRSKAEYCWTCTPSTISYVLEKFAVPECTYIDADLCFFSDPAILINEMSENGKNVLISEHRYSLIPKLYEEKRAGRFCVQFMTFTNEDSSAVVLEEWRKQCLAWCYAKHEDGKFGDQKYLEAWPGKYENVHILRHNGGGLAPWNIARYRVVHSDNEIILIDRKSDQEFTPVFYHYQFVKSIGKGYYDVGWYLLGNKVKNTFYKTYISDLEDTEEFLIRNNEMYKRSFTEMKSYLLRNPAKIFLKKILKYNILKATSNGLSS